MKKVIFAIVILLVSVGVFLIIYMKPKEKEEDVKITTSDVVLSLEDKLSKNSRWCGTMNIIWNDLRDEIVKQDIKFDEKSTLVDNLNKGTFSIKELDDSSYYKDYGKATLDLKKRIEKNIKEKFNQKSDILDQFNWDSDNYLLYTMLYKEFKFKAKFNKLEDSTFNGKGSYKYFGFESGDDDSILKNIKIIHYEENKVIMKVLTKGNDELYFYKGYKGDNFKSIFDEITKYEDEDTYYSTSSVSKVKIPYMKISDNKEIKEIENKEFVAKDGTKFIIDKALQTLKFELNEKGGKVKSEAGISFKESAMYEPYDLSFDTNFVMFIKETDKKLPYVALKVDDLEEYQKDLKD